MDELVKRLRGVAVEVANDYDVDPYNAEQRCFVIEQAADAIEVLSRDVDSTNEANIALYGALPRWIPVTERLPGRHKNVLCCGVRGGMFVGWFTNISAISGGKTIAYVHGGNGRNVTHWMPLPQLPKEE